jgi:hypothetical protein
LFFQRFASPHPMGEFGNRRKPIFAIVAHAQDSALSR